MFNFSNIQAHTEPFSHIIIDNFLNDGDEVLKQWDNLAWISEYRSKFLEQSNINLLKTELSNYFTNFNWDTKVVELLRNSHTFPNLQLIRGSHLDGIDKVYNAVIYFDDIHQNNPKHAGSFQIMEDTDDNKKPLKTIEYIHNRAVFFECTNISYHRFWSRPPYRLNFSLSLIK